VSILITCGMLIDGTGRGPVKNARLLVDGERIVAVGSAEAVTAPPGAETIDLSESTVLPGMIDCHTHLMLGFGDDLDEQYPEPPLYQTLKCVPHLRQDILPGIRPCATPSSTA